MITVIEEHECKTLKNQKNTEIGVQKYDDNNWYWVDHKRRVLNGIKFCPYCGKELEVQ